MLTRNFTPGKAFEDSEGDCVARINMTTRRSSSYDEGDGDSWKDCEHQSGQNTGNPTQAISESNRLDSTKASFFSNRLYVESTRSTLHIFMQVCQCLT